MKRRDIWESKEIQQGRGWKGSGGLPLQTWNTGKLRGLFGERAHCCLSGVVYGATRASCCWSVSVSVLISILPVLRSPSFRSSLFISLRQHCQSGLSHKGQNEMVPDDLPAGKADSWFPTSLLFALADHHPRLAGAYVYWSRFLAADNVVGRLRD
jgi:hypothetical protein